MGRRGHLSRPGEGLDMAGEAVHPRGNGSFHLPEDVKWLSVSKTSRDGPSSGRCWTTGRGRWSNSGPTMGRLAAIKRASPPIRPEDGSLRTRTTTPRLRSGPRSRYMSDPKVKPLSIESRWVFTTCQNRLANLPFWHWTER